MFGRDPIILLNLLLTSTVIYLGTNENILSVASLKNMYEPVVSNLKQARQKRDTKDPVLDKT